ncbi:MAG: tRNA lysidine(34) synthetase TilS [Butyrivibrio sp.]|nr:tRNA lysidine(34) synthetase TilS [Butyrivibrio sp.]
MNSFERKVYNFIKSNNLAASSEKILVGFSGGADSVALITVLYELRKILGIELAALHVNHGIREEAGEDASFTRRFCEDRDIEYYLVEENVPEIAREEKLTEEEAGRIVRYRAFNECADRIGARRIAVAHHMNDAAETLLYNLMRGSGIHGAGAIRPSRDNIIRPLLCVTRKEIEEYLREKEISFCTDKTNSENIHTRNKIRNKLVPYAEDEINSGVVEHLCRAAKRFADADEFIRSVSRDFFEKEAIITGECVRLELGKLKGLADIVKEDVILQCFEELTPSRKDITSAHIEAVLALTQDESGTKSVDLPYMLRAVREYDKLIIGRVERGESSFDKEEEIAVDIEELAAGTADEESGSASAKKRYNVPGLGRAEAKIVEKARGCAIPSDTYTKWFDCDRIQTAVFRHRRKDDYIYIDMDGKDCKKMLSKFMTDVKIPKNRRDEMFVLADGDHVLWVPGYRMSSRGKISEDTVRILAINIIDGGKNSG